MHEGAGHGAGERVAAVRDNGDVVHLDGLERGAGQRPAACFRPGPDDEHVLDRGGSQFPTHQHRHAVSRCLAPDALGQHRIAADDQRRHLAHCDQAHGLRAGGFDIAAQIDVAHRQRPTAHAHRGHRVHFKPYRLLG